MIQRWNSHKEGSAGISKWFAMLHPFSLSTGFNPLSISAKLNLLAGLVLAQSSVFLSPALRLAPLSNFSELLILFFSDFCMKG